MEANEYQETEIDLVELLRFLKSKSLYIIAGIIVGLVLCAGYGYFMNKNGAEALVEAKYKANASIFAGVDKEGIGFNVVQDGVYIVTGHEVLDRVISQSSNEMEYETLVESLEVTSTGGRILQVSYYSVDEETAEEIIQLIVEETISSMKNMVSNTEYSVVNVNVEPLDKGESQNGVFLLKYGMVGALAGGFFITMVLAIIHILSPRFKSKHEVEEILKLPVLAEISGSISKVKNVHAISVITMLLHTEELYSKVIGITSCKKQEGKTTIAHAIENECMKNGKKVVFVDRNEVDKIKELKKTFDLIIVDMPELELNSLALTIAQKCDSLLIVIQKNKTSYKTALECLKIVRIVGCDVKGVVLNER